MDADDREQLIELRHQLFDWARAGETVRVDVYVAAGAPGRR